MVYILGKQVIFRHEEHCYYIQMLLWRAQEHCCYNRMQLKNTAAIIKCRSRTLLLQSHAAALNGYLDSSADGENVGIEYDILGIEANLPDTSFKLLE